MCATWLQQTVATNSVQAAAERNGTPGILSIGRMASIRLELHDQSIC